MTREKEFLIRLAELMQEYEADFEIQHDLSQLGDVDSCFSVTVGKYGDVILGEKENNSDWFVGYDDILSTAKGLE